MAIQMLEEDMLWLAIERRAIDERGLSEAEKQAEVQKAESKAPDLEIEEGSDGVLHIKVRKGHVLNESAECEHLDLPISKMDVDPARKPRDKPNMDP